MNRWIVAGAAVLVACAACANGTVGDGVDTTPPDAAPEHDAALFANDATPAADDAAPIDWDATSGGGFDSGHRTYDGGWHGDSGHAFDASTFDASTPDASIDDAAIDATDAAVDSPVDDASDAATDALTTCGTLVAPSVPASCHSCTSQTCQPNGCYGGWWCNTSTNRCQSPPTTCP